MSEILIRGVVTPLTCEECPCYDNNDYSCNVTGCSVKEYRFDGRPDNCPIVEVPTPHGRLIDADALLRVIEENSYRLRGVTNSTENGMFLTGIRQAIDESPTIIEAEVRE